eukprot:SAG31_NODE_18501_length_633_cov_2.194757_1_plen_38_part_10
MTVSVQNDRFLWSIGQWRGPVLKNQLPWIDQLFSYTFL